MRRPIALVGRRVAGLLAALVALAASSAAQDGFPRFLPDDVDLPDVYTELWSLAGESESNPFHRARFDREDAERIAAGDIAGVARDLVGRFASTPWEEAPAAHARVLAHLEDFLESLTFAFADDGIDGPADTLDEQALFLARLEETGRGLEFLRLGEHPEEEVPGYFVRDDALDDAFFLYRLAEREEADGVTVPIAEGHMRDLRLLMNALLNLTQDQIKAIRGENVRDLQLAVERWDNFLDRGFSQYPWESLVNGWLIGTPELGPPSRQYVLLHPTLGIEVAADELDEARVKEALNVEVLGHVWYTGDELDNYFGASFAVSFREDLDPGLGVLLHLRRAWNLGITWHDVEEDPYLFFSVDLFRFFGEKRRQYEDVYARTKERLERIR